MTEVSQVMKKCWVVYMDMYVHVQNINDIYVRSFFFFFFFKWQCWNVFRMCSLPWNMFCHTVAHWVVFSPILMDGCTVFRFYWKSDDGVVCIFFNARCAYEGCMYVKWQEKTLITVRKQWQTFALIATFCRKYNRGTIWPNRVLPLGGRHWVEMGLEGWEGKDYTCIS